MYINVGRYWSDYSIISPFPWYGVHEARSIIANTIFRFIPIFTFTLFADPYVISLQFTVSSAWLKWIGWVRISTVNTRTLNTRIWQLDAWRHKEEAYPIVVRVASSLKVSSWRRKPAPFSPPCFFWVNSVEMQFTLMNTTASFDVVHENSEQFKSKYIQINGD